ncbi:MAG: bifunctional folylpolyglutamate synthase/dihydrofolate synthase, partial [Desulfobacteraceae bacterium]
MATVSYEECLDRIYKLGRFGIKLELDTILNILRLLNYPHKNFKTIHIAGTNGKGSTATYIASILTRAGFKTGLYTSPHLIRFNERICINGEEISDEDVVYAYEAVNMVDLGKRKATFFEIATAMALFHFARQKVDYAVIETGMGGRFDATNIVSPKVSVITNLSIEHTDYLGNTIAQLAIEKGGIIKHGRPVVTAVSQPSGLKVLEDLAQKKNTRLYRYKHDFSARKTPRVRTYAYSGIHSQYDGLVIPLPGDHQKENMSLALAACELLGEDLTLKDIRTGLGQSRWPGRLEYVQEHPTVIVDGAHNDKAAKVLATYLRTYLKEKNLTMVLGILDDKPYGSMLKTLTSCADRVIFTQATIDRSIEPAQLEKEVKAYFNNETLIIPDVRQAVSHAIETTGKDGAVCVAG